MVITELLERNARLYGGETALVEINPSEERTRPSPGGRQASSKAPCLTPPIGGS